MSELSPTTFEQFYSGGWEDIKRILRTINIGEGKMDLVTQAMVNKYQETVDREIDAILEDVYRTPLLAMNKMMPDGQVRRVFPGDITRAARYMTAALLLLNEFQGLAQNLNDQVTSYLEDSRNQIYEMRRFTHRVPGQERKSHYSHTMPPNLQPPALVERQ